MSSNKEDDDLLWRQTKNLFTDLEDQTPKNPTRTGSRKSYREERNSEEEEEEEEEEEASQTPIRRKQPKKRNQTQKPEKEEGEPPTYYIDKRDEKMVQIYSENWSKKDWELSKLNEIEIEMEQKRRIICAYQETGITEELTQHIQHSELTFRFHKAYKKEEARKITLEKKEKENNSKNSRNKKRPKKRLGKGSSRSRKRIQISWTDDQAKH